MGIDKTAIAKITSKGQLTIPKRIRDRLDLRTGDEVEFVESDGRFVIRKRVADSPFDPYVGYLGHLAGRDPDSVVAELRGHDD